MVHAWSTRLRTIIGAPHMLASEAILPPRFHRYEQLEWRLEFQRGKGARCPFASIAGMKAGLKPQFMAISTLPSKRL